MSRCWTSGSGSDDGSGAPDVVGEAVGEAVVVDTASKTSIARPAGISRRRSLATGTLPPHDCKGLPGQGILHVPLPRF